MSRNYLPIWGELKEKGEVEVQCAVSLQKRLIKAVIKEKYQDVDAKEFYGKLTITRKGDRVSFSIKRKIRSFDL